MHVWWVRGNAVLTLCTSVLAAICISVTITGTTLSQHLPSCHMVADSADSLTQLRMRCVRLYADLLHKSDPFVHVDLVEVQGLQREYDRFLGHRERVCCLLVTKSHAFVALSVSVEVTGRSILASSVHCCDAGLVSCELDS